MILLILLCACSFVFYFSALVSLIGCLLSYVIWLKLSDGFYFSSRFLGGICCALVILVSFVLSQELIGTSWRSFCGMCVAMVFAIGIGIYSWLASIMSDWRTLTLVCSLSGIVFLLLPW